MLLGLAVGLAGGLFGIGGGVVLIPALTELFGPAQHKYQAVSMIVGFFVTTPAVYHHFRAGAIDGANVRRLLPIVGFAVIAGVLLSEVRLFSGEGEAYLRLIFGAFLVYCAVAESTGLVRRLVQPAALLPGRESEPATWPVATLIALPTGLIAGLLGVGGGILAVPLQRRLLRIDLRTAIANSATIMIATSLIGACAKNYAYLAGGENESAPLRMAAVVVPTAIFGSLVGSRLTHLLPVRMLKRFFLALLLIAAVRICYFAIKALG